jgi:hypothetical protein
MQHLFGISNGALPEVVCFIVVCFIVVGLQRLSSGDTEVMCFLVMGLQRLKLCGGELVVVFGSWRRGCCEGGIWRPGEFIGWRREKVKGSIYIGPWITRSRHVTLGIRAVVKSERGEDTCVLSLNFMASLSYARLFPSSLSRLICATRVCGLF